MKKITDTNEVIDFIQRRFPTDCMWKSGNCYYFALILHNRFPNSRICYDVVDGHFCVKIDDVYYDWEGIYTPDCFDNVIAWEQFDDYDTLRKQRIIRDCLQ